MKNETANKMPKKRIEFKSFFSFFLILFLSFFLFLFFPHLSSSLPDMSKPQHSKRQLSKKFSDFGRVKQNIREAGVPRDDTGGIRGVV